MGGACFYVYYYYINLLTVALADKVSGKAALSVTINFIRKPKVSEGRKSTQATIATGLPIAFCRNYNFYIYNLTFWVKQLTMQLLISQSQTVEQGFVWWKLHSTSSAAKGNSTICCKTEWYRYIIVM